MSRRYVDACMHAHASRGYLLAADQDRVMIDDDDTVAGDRRPAGRSDDRTSAAQHRRKGAAWDKKRSRPRASRRRTHVATAACGSIERPQPVPRKMARGETSAATGRRFDALSGGGVLICARAVSYPQRRAALGPDARRRQRPLDVRWQQRDCAALIRVGSSSALICHSSGCCVRTGR